VARYTFTVLALTLATLLRFALTPFLGEGVPFILYFPTVVLCAWFGGLWPGLLSTALGGLIAWFVFIPPHDTFAVSDLTAPAQLITFLLAGILISLLAESLHRAWRKTAESETRERQQREQLRVTLASIGDAVIATDAKGQVAFMNQVAESLTGWKHEETLGKPLQEIFHVVNEQTRKTVENPALRAMREGLIFGLANHTVLIAKNGTERPIDDSGAPIKDADGKTLGAVLIFRDVTERKRAEQTLADRLNEIETIMEVLPVGLFIAQDRAGTRIVGNRVAREFLQMEGGLDVNLSVSAPSSEGPLHFKVLKDGQEIQPAELPVQRAAAEGIAVHHLELDVVFNDGTVKHELISALPLLDQNGAPRGAVASMMDITARKQAEEALRESEQRFRLVADAAPVMFWMSGTDKLCTWFNRPWLDFVGRPMEQELGNGWAENVHPGDFDCCLRTYTTSFDARQSFSMEYRLRRHDGEYRWVLDNGISLYGPGRKFTGYIGSCVDITGRKRAEEELLQQREWLRTTLASIGDAVIATDTKGFVTFLNPVAQTLTGWKQEEAEGTPLLMIFNIMNEQTRQTVENPALRAMREGVIVGLANRTILIAKNGAEIPIDDSGAPIKDSEGNILGAVLIFRDITERRRTEAERSRLLASERAARERAETANRAKDEFVAAVSHEVRTPLNAVLGWAQMLRRGKLDKKETARAIETIERNAKAQATIIEDLLDISRVITGKLNLNVRPVELLPIIEYAMDAIRPAADAKSIQLRVHHEPTRCLVSGDPQRLQQIFWNLLSNAVKFTPKCGWVEVRSERTGSQLQITVSDSGAGINPEFLPYVFDRFSQATIASRAKYGGLGLGLALVRYLVELHGGTVRADSAGEGQGAAFTIQLPIRAVLEGPTDFEQISEYVVPFADTIMLDGLRVMVVDDEEEARDLLATMLTKHGAEVKACASAAEALAAMEQWRPSLLVSDIGMPNEDGYAFIRQVRALGPERGGKYSGGGSDSLCQK
jgi:PAS domain S-box-containing protein